MPKVRARGFQADVQAERLGDHFRTVCIFSAVHVMSTTVRSPTFQSVLPWCMTTHFLGVGWDLQFYQSLEDWV